jgi:hypothetical protein
MLSAASGVSIDNDAWSRLEALKVVDKPRHVISFVKVNFVVKIVSEFRRFYLLFHLAC